jgi:glycosyltransferase involved in cell wall biosynthesis
MSQPTISVILITKNEAALIRQALDSVAWADEIVVVDSGSTDGTVEICREYTDKVFETDWPGFGPQKNRALDHARGDWVLSIDADEHLTPELAQEIRQVLAAPQAVGYKLPRLSSFCGRYMRHSGWWPDPVLRLFRRDAGRFSDDRVHERVIVDGTVRTLNGLLLHESYRSLDQLLDKVNHYSREGALARHEKGKQAGLGKAIGHGIWAFVRTYLLRRGFLDGAEGFIVAFSNAEASYYRYLKLMYLNKPGGGR